MMKIFHLDAGRKYFSLATIKGMIDVMSEAGFTHLELYFSDNQGFRFGLPDPVIRTSYGTYDLSRALGDGYCETPKAPSGGGWLTVPEMEEIVRYIKEKGMELIPLMNMPGHMGTILQTFSDFRYPGSHSSLNLNDPEAVEFALEILRRYVDYFAGLGCKYFHFGADEFANDLGQDPDHLIMGLDRIYEGGDMKQFVCFVNRAVEIVCQKGLIPMVFNDGVCYHDDDTTYGAVDKRAMVCYWTKGWDGYSPASVAYLDGKGYQLVNTDDQLYCVMGWDGWDTKAEIASKFDPHLFCKETTVEHPAGGMLCLWCDRGDMDGQDDGKAVAERMEPIMRSFGKAMERF